MSSVTNPHHAVIYVMVTVSAADGSMTDREMRMMGDIVKRFPMFDDFAQDNLIIAAQECAAILSGNSEGLETVLGLAREALPERLRETAYACAVEVAAADERINQEELRVLELIRAGLEVDRLVAAAIIRSARARYTRA